MIKIPYTVGNAPDYVKKLPPKLQRMWVKVFNSAWRRCKAQGKSDKACETFAFRNANGVVKRQGKNMEVDSVTNQDCGCQEVTPIEAFSEENLAANVGSEDDPETFDSFEEGIPEELQWTTKQKGALPNAAFAVVEPCWKTNKGARHLPHHKSSVKSASENGSIDLPHLRNALARMNQIKAVCPGVSTGAIRARAKGHLVRHAKAVLPTSKFAGAQSGEELAKALDELIRGLEKITFTDVGWRIEL